MEDKQECANEGLSLREIFRTIWLRKWVTLGVALAIFLVCIISIFYGYNPSKKYYEAEFSLNLPGSDGTAVYIYPDGSQFHYTDMVSRETLETIKESAEEFSGVDVDNMAKKGNISISRNTVTNENVSETYYTLSVKANYFTNAEQAKNFLMSLANTSISRLSNMDIDYDIYLTMAKDTIDYETEISFLKNQLGVLQSGYNSLISTYGGNFVGNAGSGKTLLAYSQELNAYLESGVLDNLLSELRDKKIIKSPDCEDYYKQLIATLERECKIKQDALDSVLKPDGTNSVIIGDASVLRTAEEIAELNSRIEAFKAYAGATVETGFLDKAYSMVEGFTKTYTDTCKNVYFKASAVVFTRPGIVVATGGFGTTTIVLLSLVVAVIVALIAGYVAGKLKLRSVNGVKNKADKVQTETLPDAECGEGNGNKKE